MVDSTDTVQSTSPFASAGESSAVRILSQVPSSASRRYSFMIVCHGPKSAGNIAPRDSRSVSVDDTFNDPAVVPERASSTSVGRGKHRLDQ
jgi:hypothetical protein